MSTVEIKKVVTRKDLRRFVDFHYTLYEGNPYDAPELFSSVMDTFTPEKNAAYDFCDVELYVALKDGKIAGRVAAIINRNANEKWGRKCVRFGWIDYINDMNVLSALMQAVEDFGKSHGMTEVAGPLGFTDMDPEGMLTEGFDQLGTMAEAYNYEYYPQLFEQLPGFEIDNKYIEVKMTVPPTVPEKYAKIAEVVEKRYNLHVKKITKRDVFEGGYGERIFKIVNDTYADLYGYSQLTDKQIKQYIDNYLRFVDMNLITLIEDWNADKKIVGLGISIPSLARALQKCRHGHLFPFGWWHLLRAIKQHKTEGVELLLVGVLPEYRAKAANVLLFTDLIPRYVEYGFKWGETNVEMESNVNVQSQWQIFDPVIHKRRKCYKKSI